ncbi:hypothetical protein HMPREF9418_0455 [Neisseria macacae ATCC 33926]|uniref:Uncharacterized protein n=1 Tax=Neisseria macacae ATCC 33926 TaxID=997348 RepID=A0AA36XLR0_9NEIS|nr:hypothetical protein HMPREF9418_0455 [Neisseria macacae ATCC 33926]
MAASKVTAPLSRQTKSRGRLKTLIPVFRRPFGKYQNQFADSTP